MPHFTLIDILQTLKASFALIPFMFGPGYVAGSALNLFEFRQRRPLFRLVLALPLSIAICPMLSYLLGRFAPLALWLFYAGTSIAWIILLTNDARRGIVSPGRHEIHSKYVRIAQVLALSWVVFAIFLLVDVQVGDKLYPPVEAYDHSVRASMTIALLRHIPPENPFFAHALAPLRYHYLWLLFCSLPGKVIELSARHIVDAGVIWCGLALMCTIALGLKFLVGTEDSLARRTSIGIGLLCVTGLDIFPVLYLALGRSFWLSDTEWWNEGQISSWVGSVLWVPHNVAALIACFTGFVLIRHQLATRRWATAPVIIAGMAFASAIGMSVYVTFTFVIAIALWLLVLVARKEWLEAGMFVAAGAVAILCALSFLSSLRGSASGGQFAEFTLRSFDLGVALARRMGIPIDTPSAVTLANALFLPLNYAMELGFFFLIGILRLRQLVQGKIQATNDELAGWTLVASSFLIGTFLRSSTISSNDLGWRCFLPAQLILLLWGAAMVDDWCFHRSSVSIQPKLASWARTGVAALLILGLAGTAYQVFMLRAFPILLDHTEIRGQSWLVPDHHFGNRAYALRSVYESLDSQFPSSAIFQGNPASDDLILHMLYSGRDAAAGDGKCGTDFGGDAKVCAVRLQKLGALFSPLGIGNVDAVCGEYGINAIVVEDLDPVWRNPSSWVWTRHPIVSNDYVRAFRCGSTAPQG